MPFGIDFPCDFGGFLVEKWRQVGTNNDPKSINILVGLGLIFDRILVDFGNQNGAKLNQNRIEN